MTDAVHQEHLKQPERKPAAPSWPPWLPADGSSGVPHLRPGTGDECPYLAIVVCGKCGWADPDPERVKAAADLLERARRTVTPEKQAAQRKAWKAAVSARNAEQRRSRARRPGKPISGYVIRFPRKGGDR